MTSVRALDARPVQPALLEFVRGLVFAPVADRHGRRPARREGEGRARGRARGTGHAALPSEIEVEISTR